ncbi:Glutamate receptor 2.1 [Cardamine amara subsp. amara]|uniref:Glutamate receptor 2.1 n=1 Tax=Cardamine amara subsp. amara TaxID=228776 RepID=A0ABD1AUK6_CARAN
MKREINLVLSLLFFVIVFLMQVGEAQNRPTDVNLGIVNDIGMAYSNMTLLLDSSLSSAIKAYRSLESDGHNHSMPPETDRSPIRLLLAAETSIKSCAENIS